MGYLVNLNKTMDWLHRHPREKAVPCKPFNDCTVSQSLPVFFRNLNDCAATEDVLFLADRLCVVPHTAWYLGDDEVCQRLRTIFDLAIIATNVDYHKLDIMLAFENHADEVSYILKYT